MDPQHTSLLDSIAEKAVDLDWNVAFDGKSKGNRHLFRVNTITKHLLSREGGDRFITLAAAWVHDVTLATNLDDDPDEVYQYTADFLNSFDDLTDDEKERIAQCAASHESGDTDILEAQIVHDADVIDKSGMLGVIRHIWKVTNMIKERILDADDVEELRKHLESRNQRLHTDTARSIVEKLTQRQREFFETPEVSSHVISISEMVSEGYISDTIAERLIEASDEGFTQTLRAQLNCDIF